MIKNAVVTKQPGFAVGNNVCLKNQTYRRYLGKKEKGLYRHTRRKDDIGNV
jgi:hypothetical protein